MDESQELNLEQFIEGAAKVLELPIDPTWMPTIKANLQVTLRLGKDVAAFALPDEAEPAFVFEA